MNTRERERGKQEEAGGDIEFDAVRGSCPPGTPTPSAPLVVSVGAPTPTEMCFFVSIERVRAIWVKRLDQGRRRLNEKTGRWRLQWSRTHWYCRDGVRCFPRKDSAKETIGSFLKNGIQPVSLVITRIST